MRVPFDDGSSPYEVLDSIGTRVLTARAVGRPRRERGARVRCSAALSDRWRRGRCALYVVLVVSRLARRRKLMAYVFGSNEFQRRIPTMKLICTCRANTCRHALTYHAPRTHTRTLTDRRTRMHAHAHTRTRMHARCLQRAACHAPALRTARVLLALLRRLDVRVSPSALPERSELDSDCP